MTDYPALLSEIEAKLQDIQRQSNQALTIGPCQECGLDVAAGALVGWALERLGAMRIDYQKWEHANSLGYYPGPWPCASVVPLESLARALGLLPKEGE